MQTIKLKYQTSEENLKVISDFQRQYSSCLHYLYNRLKDNPSVTEKELRCCQKDLNNIDLIKSYLFQCAIKETKQIIKSNDKPIIFGGKNNEKGLLIGNNKGGINGWTKQVYGRVVEVL